MEFILTVVAVIGMVSFYLIPVQVAYWMDHPQIFPIFIFNLLLGWLVIGWLLAIVWAVWIPESAKQNSVDPEADS